MDISQEEWIKVNQNYLIAEINVVKAKLRVYQEALEEKSDLVESSQFLEKATSELEQMERAHSIHTRLKILVEIFQLSPFEKQILLLGVGIELDASLGELIEKLQVGSGARMPTLSLALSAFSEAHWSAIASEGALRYWHLIELNKSSVLTNSTFTVDELILHYLIGINTMDSRLSSFVSVIRAKNELVPSHQKIAQQITLYLSQPTDTGLPPLIQLKGNSTEDQKAIIGNIFGQYNLSVYSLAVQLLPANFQEIAKLSQLWNREAILYQYVLFLDGRQLDNQDQARVKYIEYLLEKTRGVVIISAEHKFTALSRSLYHVKVDKPKREEQEVLWLQELGQHAQTLDRDIGKLVTQFNLDSHSIMRLARQASANNSINGATASHKFPLKEKLWKACCNYTRPNLSSLAQRIEAIANWDDLVLPAAQKAILKEICIHVQQRQKVYGDWGFRSKSNRGLGISALFAGESGTGKTMASEVIANALNLDLYRIDLSQVVNKYIGETEKNLKKVFDAAEDSGAILLFDEADALFGKRSDVKDSHDRYSNIEVSYLLQKMEEYRGLAILTTNMKNALDKAFLRRIRFVIQFPFPDAKMRGEIWKRVFPKETPTQALNISKLANLHIAGGNIRNIALNASFAAAHKDQPVTMWDIQNAARSEYVKLEKHMSPSESLL